MEIGVPPSPPFSSAVSAMAPSSGLIEAPKKLPPNIFFFIKKKNRKKQKKTKNKPEPGRLCKTTWRFKFETPLSFYIITNWFDNCAILSIRNGTKECARAARTHTGATYNGIGDPMLVSESVVVAAWFAPLLFGRSSQIQYWAFFRWNLYGGCLRLSCRASMPLNAICVSARGFAIATNLIHSPGGIRLLVAPVLLPANFSLLLLKRRILCVVGLRWWQVDRVEGVSSSNWIYGFFDVFGGSEVSINGYLKKILKKILKKLNKNYRRLKRSKLT